LNKMGSNKIADIARKAKEIRKKNEKWTDAIKRASKIVKKS